MSMTPTPATPQPARELTPSNELFITLHEWSEHAFLIFRISMFLIVFSSGLSVGFPSFSVQELAEPLFFFPLQPPMAAMSCLSYPAPIFPTNPRSSSPTEGCSSFLHVFVNTFEGSGSSLSVLCCLLPVVAFARPR